jgi:hypothetical protein
MSDQERRHVLPSKKLQEVVVTPPAPDRDAVAPVVTGKPVVDVRNLAVPMIMMLKAICDHVEDLQPIGELLGE